MDFADLLRRRRIVRHYRPEPIADAVVQRIVGVVHRAPSAGFSQGARLVVVTAAEGRRAIADIAEPWYLERGFQPWISTAPVHVVIGVRQRSYHERYREPDKLDAGHEIPWPVPFWWFDAGALFTLLELAAIDEGLATGFFSPADPGALAAMARSAGLADDVAVVGVLTLGVAGDDAAVRDRSLEVRRRPIDELVRWRR